jgi:hypothetical protein
MFAVQEEHITISEKDAISTIQNDVTLEAG